MTGTGNAAVKVDFTDMAVLGDAVRVHGRTRPEAIAFDFEGRQTTFGELDAHTSQVANALVAAGVKPGERVAYLGKNSDHYFELFLGCAKAGVVMVPVGWRLSQVEQHMPETAETATAFVLAGDIRLMQAQAELQALAQAMESGTLPLAQMLDGYRRASVLLRYCHAQLDALEQQILQIDGGELKPWTPDAGTL